MPSSTNQHRDWPPLTDPDVTVLTVWHNRQPFVASSIASLLNQDYPKLTIVAVDDGSTDGTLEALRAFHDSRLEVRTQSNRGFTASLQQHIPATSGEVIAIHGAGDISLPTRISTQVAVLEKNPDVGFVGSWYVDVDTNGTNTLKQPRLTGDAYKTLLKRNPFSHGTLLLRRDVIARAGGYRSEFTYAQVYDLLIRMSLVTNGRVVEEPLYHRLLLPDGVATVREKRLLQRAFAALAVDCGRQRAQIGFDTVDRFGTGALAFRPRSPMVSNWLAQFALRAIVAHDYDGAAYFSRLALDERWNARNAALACVSWLARRSPRARRTLDWLRSANASRQKVRPG